jgi:hypothetical protein
MIAGVLIVLIFLVAAGLMITRRVPALLALPGMALAIGLVAGLAAGLPWQPPAAPEGAQPGASLSGFLLDKILTQGASRLAAAMMFAIFGAILSQVVLRQGIARQIVRTAAEFAGDRKLLLAFLLTAAIAVAFSSLSGLGAVIMIGSLALPILIGAGLSPTYSGCLLLWAISLGGMFNAANWALYLDLLGVERHIVAQFAREFGLLMALAATAFLLLEGRKERARAWALSEPGSEARVPACALLTPLLPVGLIMAARWPIIPSFLVGVVYGLLTTEPRRFIPNFTAAILEGLKDVSPVLGLFIGIGMTLNALMDETTRQIMDPFIRAVVPTSTAGYVLFFSLLAPLGLYRGPLNLVGLGAGFAALVLATGLLPPVAIMVAFFATGQIQGVCDPTNTHNVWIAQFTHTSAEDFLKRTLPYVWAFVVVALIYAVMVKGIL